MVRELILSIDAMGGDPGPATIVAGAAIARKRHPKVRFLLHGDEAILKPLLAKHRTLAKVAEIRHAPDVVSMSEKPSQALRRGRKSSMFFAIEAVARKEADVAVSAGNTGALMAIAMFRLGVIKGIARPAIAVLWPTMRGQSVVLDVGANAGSDAEQLVDFAVMGEAFARAVFGIDRPTVGLLNIGEEDAKGIEPVKRAAHILRQSKLPIEFCGFVEGDGIGKGLVDVVVTDGFTGNVALKTAEGTAKLVVFYLKNAFMRSLLSRLGAVFASGALKTLRQKLDPRALNGGVFLGLDGVVVKSHGGTDALGFASAIDLALDMAESDIPAHILKDRAGITEITAPANGADQTEAARSVTSIRSVIIGTGSSLPENVVSNDDLAQRMDTSDAWIFERTGIRRRHIAIQGQTTSTLALDAAKRALASAGVPASELDLVIVATTTPDETFPSVATMIQARLGMTRGAAFDVQAVCAGFIYALSVADNFIRAGQAHTVLVIGAETMSRLVDWNDRTTCVLFGDGAGAVVLQSAHGKGGNTDRGILNTKIFSDGRLHDLLYTDGGVSSTGTAGHLRMQGREVFKHAVLNVTAAMEQSCQEAGYTPADVDWFVPHQANQRILDGTARKLGIPHEKVVSTIADHGNTSAASVPLALAVAVADGRIQRGQLVLLEAMGGGFTWGAALVRW